MRASNLYSKVAGGSLEFSAFLANGGNSTIQKGNLVLRDFDVRNEAALADIDSRGKSRKSGPRNEGLSFTKLNLAIHDRREIHQDWRFIAERH